MCGDRLGELLAARDLLLATASAAPPRPTTERPMRPASSMPRWAPAGAWDAATHRAPQPAPTRPTAPRPGASSQPTVIGVRPGASSQPTVIGVRPGVSAQPTVIGGRPGAASRFLMAEPVAGRLLDIYA
jgi:hypothetical protein